MRKIRGRDFEPLARFVDSAELADSFSWTQSVHNWDPATLISFPCPHCAGEIPIAPLDSGEAHRKSIEDNILINMAEIPVPDASGHRFRVGKCPRCRTGYYGKIPQD